MSIDYNAHEAENLLRHCEFFQDFSPDDLEVLTQYIDIRNGHRGDVLYFENEQADAMYVVAQGRVELLINDEDGQPRLVGWLGPAESFGELALLLRGRRMVTVRATNDVLLYELSLASFMRMRTNHPDVCLLVVMSGVKRFGQVMSASQDLLRRFMLHQLSRV